MRDLMWIVTRLILAIIALIALYLLFGGATLAAEDDVVFAPIGNLTTRTINQGDTVYWGETIDVRNVYGWNYRLVHVDSGKIVDVSAHSHRVLIRPDIFPVGEWDQWSEGEESHGNLLAFYVEATSEEKKVELRNTTKNVTNATIGQNLTDVLKYDLEPRFVSDVFVARGDQLDYPTGVEDAQQAWMFGTFEDKDMLLAVPLVDGKLTLTAQQTQDLSVGNYVMLIETAGANTILEANVIEPDYDHKITYHIESPFRAAPFLEIGGTKNNPGLAPTVLMVKLKEWISTNTDDLIYQRNFSVQTPYLEINEIDEIWDGKGKSWKIQGYTNLKDGSEVYALLDENLLTTDALRAKNAVKSKVIDGYEDSDIHGFVIIHPINYEDISNGEHYVTVHGDHNTFMTVQRWVYTLTADKAKELNVTTKYSGGNLFVPTPTPIVVVVNTSYEVTRVVTVTITPEPTPVPPWYTQQPWLWAEIIFVVIITTVVMIWIFWKKGMI